MNIWKALAPPTKAAGMGGNTTVLRTPEERQDWIRGHLADNTESMAQKVAWWYGGVNKIARMMSAARIQVAEYQDEAYTPVVDHPIELAMKRPNAFQSKRELLYRWTQSMFHRGEAFLFIGVDGNDVGEIQLLHPALIDVVGSKERVIDHYDYHPDGKGPGRRSERIEPDQIIMSRFPDPRDVTGVRGMAPLTAASMGLVAEWSMQRWGNNFFGKSGGLPMAIISTPPDADRGTQVLIEDNFEASTADGRRDPIVVPAGQIDIKTIDFQPDQMGFDALRGINRQMIEYILGIPEALASNDANRANSSNARLGLIETLIWPLVELLVADMNTQWPIGTGGLTALQEFQAEDMKERNEKAHDDRQKRLEATQSTNEIRAEDGKDPIDVKALMPLFPKLSEDEGGEQALEALFDEMPAALAKVVVVNLVKPKPQPVPPELGGPPDPNKPMPPGGDQNKDTDPPKGDPPDPKKTDDDDVNADARSYQRMVIELAGWRAKAYRAAKAGEPLPLEYDAEEIPEYIADGLKIDLAAEGAENRIGTIFRDWQEAL